MKCLMLLVLVAVCRGFVLRDELQDNQRIGDPQKMKDISHVERLPESLKRSIQHKMQKLASSRRYDQEEHLKRSPSEYSRLDRKLMEQSPLEVSTDLSKEIVKSPLQLLPVKTPYGQYTTPRTFLEYIETLGNRRPWNQMTPVYPDVLDFETFRDLIQFPGGDFLQNEIDKCLWKMSEDSRVPVDLPIDEYTSRLGIDQSLQIDMRKVQGIHDVLPYILTKLEKTVPLYMQTTNDPSTLAMLVTRDLIKVVLHGRMKCPTTSWDKYFIENVNEQLVKTIEEQKYQLLENLRNIVPEMLPEVPDRTDQLVYTIAKDVQQHLYKDAMQYAHGVAFKDVAILSHKLYHEVKRVFEDGWQQDVSTLMQQLVAVVTEIISNYGTCPSEQFIYRKNVFACWDFKNLFLEREWAQIHSRVMNIVNHFLYSTCTGEQCMQFDSSMTEMLKPIVKQCITSVFQHLPICQTPECQDPTQCLLTNQFLEPSQMEQQADMKIPFWYPLGNKREQDLLI